MYTKEILAELFEILESCVGVEHSEKHHPEGDVFNHSIQVLMLAIKESDDIDLVVAAMMHDVGKAYDSKEHDKIGPKLLSNHLSEKSLWLVENHMRVWYYLKGEMKKLSKTKKLCNNKWFPELIQLARWDKMGRNPNVVINYNRQKLLEKLLELQK